MSEKLFHIRLDSYERKALEFVRMKQAPPMSATKTIGVCIKAAALQLGFNGTLDAAEDIFKKRNAGPA